MGEAIQVIDTRDTGGSAAQFFAGGDTGTAMQMTLAGLNESHTPALTLDIQLPLSDIIDRFDREPGCFAVLATGDDQLPQLISREWLQAQLARPAARETYLHQPVAALLGAYPLETLELAETTTISEAIEMALWRQECEHYQPMVVLSADGGRWLLNVKDLLLKQCRMLASTLTELEIQRQATDVAESERRRLQQRLLAASRDAGRAEIATGILHDVGNVLNSINVSASVLGRALQQSKLHNLGRSVKMIEEHAADAGAFFTADDRGRRLPGYLAKLFSTLTEEHSDMSKELGSLQRNIEHVRHVVQMQQSYAKGSTLREIVPPAALVEDALQMNLVSFERHNVNVVRDFAVNESVLIDRHKVLQILVNLISNAKDATKANTSRARQIRCGIEQRGAGWLRFQVSDNGTGINSENLTRIFNHGFTTRKEGHGFGLHASANAAKEMGGTLTAASDGPGCGATFTLDLPAEAESTNGRPGGISSIASGKAAA